MEITELNFTTMTARIEYPKDNGLNRFGDYTHLEAVRTRWKARGSGRVTAPVWRLVNKETGLVQKLSSKEARECIHTLFFSSAIIEYK